MPQTRYQVTRSAGGNVAVTVSADDPAVDEVEPRLGRADLRGAADGHGEKDDQVEDQPEEEKAPIRAVHHVPMVRQRGRYGSSGTAASTMATGGAAPTSRKASRG